jgi:hypothetical protein
VIDKLTIDEKKDGSLFIRALDKLSDAAPLTYKVFTVLGNVGDKRVMQDKRVATAIALSMLFTSRSQRFSGVGRLFGVAFVLLGINRTILASLTKMRLCCSLTTVNSILNATSTDEIVRTKLSNVTPAFKHVTFIIATDSF